MVHDKDLHGYNDPISSAECAGLAGIPAGNWFCPRCKRQSGRKGTTKIKLRGSSRAGGTPGKENNDDHYTRILTATDTVSSGCVFCRYMCDSINMSRMYFSTLLSFAG